MLILLDIDGVMVPAKSWSPPAILEDGFSVFNPAAVVALNKIIAKSNADILLTTSHKERFSTEEWVNIFRNRNIFLENIKRLPDNVSNLSRREEISNWFLTNKISEEFVIIDDDNSLNDLSSYLKSRLVLTKSLIGLTSSYVEETLKILNTPLKFA